MFAILSPCSSVGAFLPESQPAQPLFDETGGSGDRGQRMGVMAVGQDAKLWHPKGRRFRIGLYLFQGNFERDFR